MNIISRLRFPSSPDVSGLYIRWNNNDSSSSFSRDSMTLQGGETISFNTYFNSFYESLYAKYTNLTDLYYLLDLEGSFKVSIYRERYSLDRQLINTFEFFNCNSLNGVKVPLKINPDSKELGRVYLELTSLENNSKFNGGSLITEQTKTRDVSLAIITCTFKKEEYLKKTVKTIIEDSLIASKDIKLFVVDNGNTLKNQDLNYDRLKLIPNKNVGGSGGFTRGLIEAIEENKYTHFVFMDDDIFLDSETIYRILTIYEYSKVELAIAGSMLDLLRKHLLYEAGAKYGFRLASDSSDILIEDSLVCAPLKHKLYLQDPNILNSFLVEEDIDYGGFWLFTFSKELVVKSGLLMPFFIKVDDMEFGLRIKNLADTYLLTFPSIAVWHDPFYAKKPIWDIYYYTRNTLICNSIHKNISCWTTIKRLTRRFLGKLFVFDYNSSELTIKALEHYLQGPDFLKNQDTEELHPVIIKTSKIHPQEWISSEEKSKNLYKSDFNQYKTPNILDISLSLITLNGHILPGFLLDKNNEALILDASTFWVKVLGKNKVCVDEGHKGFRIMNMNKKVGITLFVSWLLLIIKTFLSWSNINRKWKNNAPEMRNIKFWKKYLGLENNNYNSGKITQNNNLNRVKAEII